MCYVITQAEKHLKGSTDTHISMSEYTETGKISISIL